MLEILRAVVDATNGLFGPVVLFSLYSILLLRLNRTYGWKRTVRISSFLMIAVSLPLAIASNRFGVNLANTETIVFFMIMLVLSMIPWGD